MALQSACNQRRYTEAVPLRIITVGWYCTPKHVANVRLVALGFAFSATAPRQRRNVMAAAAAAAAAATAAAAAATAAAHTLALALALGLALAVALALALTLARTHAGLALPFLEPNLRKPKRDDEARRLAEHARRLHTRRLGGQRDRSTRTYPQVVFKFTAFECPFKLLEQHEGIDETRATLEHRD